MTKKRTIVSLVVAGVALLAVGGAIGAAVSGDRSPAQSTAPVERAAASDPTVTAVDDAGSRGAAELGTAAGNTADVTRPDDRRGVPEGLIGLAAAGERATDAVGGTVIDIDLDDEHGRSVYEVAVVTDTGTTEVLLDARTGEVLGQKPEDAEDAAEDARLAARARVPAVPAIATATAAVPGEPVDLELSDHWGSVVFEIDVVTAEGTFEVLVDATTGEVVGQWHDEPDHDD